MRYTLTVTAVMVTCLRCCSAETAACDAGWFGKNCSFRCHCSHGCDKDGACTQGGGCVVPYFGYACQYVDITVPHQLYPALTDNDETTCLSEQKDSISIQMKTMAFRYFRLHFSKAMVWENVKYDLSHNESNIILCVQNFTIYVSAFVQDFHCYSQQEVTDLQLTGQGINYLCEVYISGGRNIALKQHVDTSSGNDNQMAINDGYSNGSDTCFSSSQSPSEWIKVTFPNPVFILELVIVNKPGSACSIWGFQLFFHDFENGMHHVFSGNIADDDKDIRVININSLVPAMSYTMELTAVNHFADGKSCGEPKDTNVQISVCELEAYGDCLFEKSGLNCNQTCSSRCEGGICDIEGNCQSCIVGFYGPKCLTECSTGCKEIGCQRDGACFNCAPGYYGTRCRKACQNCGRSGCDRQNGTCHECTAGYTGPDCMLSCSYTCDKKVCDRNGSCLECLPGYHGKNCMSECEPGYYGVGCLFECSPVCEKRCTKVEGLCIKCPEKMYGMSCENTCSQHCRLQLCKVDGLCEHGCEEGYFSDDCSKVTCSENCEGHSSPCDDRTGHCLRGCKPGFGGLDCTKDCSNCIDGLCDITNMTCTIGCIRQRTKNDLCKGEIGYSRKENNPMTDWTLVALITVTVVSLCSLTILNILFIFRRLVIPVEEDTFTF